MTKIAVDAATAPAGSIVPEGGLAYGMQLPVQARSLTMAEPWEIDAGRDELEAVARHADQTGFLYVAVCDHTVTPRPRDEHMRTVWFDTVATLGMLAGVTTRVRLLSNIYVVSLRHPLHVAKAFLTLDALSKGRVVLGVGTGYLEREFEILGVDFAGRGARTTEAIEMIRAALTDEYPQFAGPTWKVDDAGIAPRPVQHHVPIWVGGSSAPALRRAAVHGDGWLPQETRRPELRKQIAYLLEHRRKSRGDDPINLGGWACIYVGKPTWDVGDCVSGTPDEIGDSLREFRGMGVSHVQLRIRNRSLQELLDQMEAFSTSVAPLIAG